MSVCNVVFMFIVDPTVKPRRLTEDLWSLIRSWQVPAFCPKDGHPTNQLRYRGHVRWCHPSGWCAQCRGAGLGLRRQLHLLDRCYYWFYKQGTVERYQAGGQWRLQPDRSLPDKQFLVCPALSRGKKTRHLRTTAIYWGDLNVQQQLTLGWRFSPHWCPEDTFSVTFHVRYYYGMQESGLIKKVPNTTNTGAFHSCRAVGQGASWTSCQPFTGETDGDRQPFMFNP